jgi:hypothetical protein
MCGGANNTGTTRVLADSVSPWSNLHKLYPLYFELARESSLEIRACDGVHQLRQYLQTSRAATGELLYQLLVHHRAKSRHGDSDRDKVDFLALQYLFERVPCHALGPHLSFDQAAELLAPIVGLLQGATPEWLARLEELVANAHSCRSLNKLLTTRVIEQGCEMKSDSGEQFFSPGGLVVFARFGFLRRRVFFRLMHEDLKRIFEALCQLEAEGFATLDCRKAQFSSEERVARLRMIYQSWKLMLQTKHSSAQPLCILVDLRTAVRH